MFHRFITKHFVSNIKNRIFSYFSCIGLEYAESEPPQGGLIISYRNTFTQLNTARIARNNWGLSFCLLNIYTEVTRPQIPIFHPAFTTFIHIAKSLCAYCTLVI